MSTPSGQREGPLATGGTGRQERGGREPRTTPVAPVEAPWQRIGGVTCSGPYLLRYRLRYRRCLGRLDSSLASGLGLRKQTVAELLWAMKPKGSQP